MWPLAVDSRLCIAALLRLCWLCLLRQIRLVRLLRTMLPIAVLTALRLIRRLPPPFWAGLMVVCLTIADRFFVVVIVISRGVVAAGDREAVSCANLIVVRLVRAGAVVVVVILALGVCCRASIPVSGAERAGPSAAGRLLFLLGEVCVSKAIMPVARACRAGRALSGASRLSLAACQASALGERGYMVSLGA